MQRIAVLFLYSCWCTVQAAAAIKNATVYAEELRKDARDAIAADMLAGQMNPLWSGYATLNNQVQSPSGLSLSMVACQQLHKYPIAMQGMMGALLKNNDICRFLSLWPSTAATQNHRMALRARAPLQSSILMTSLISLATAFIQ